MLALGQNQTFEQLIPNVCFTLHSERFPTSR